MYIKCQQAKHIKQQLELSARPGSDPRLTRTPVGRHYGVCIPAFCGLLAGTNSFQSFSRICLLSAPHYQRKPSHSRTPVISDSSDMGCAYLTQMYQDALYLLPIPPRSREQTANVRQCPQGTCIHLQRMFPSLCASSKEKGRPYHLALPEIIRKSPAYLLSGDSRDSCLPAFPLNCLTLAVCTCLCLMK